MKANCLRRLFLIFTISSTPSVQAATDWFCKNETSQKTGDNYLICGVAEAPKEADARIAALRNALQEFDTLCRPSATCFDRPRLVEPKRSECEKIKESDLYKCYRAIEVKVLAKNSNEKTTKKAVRLESGSEAADPIVVNIFTKDSDYWRGRAAANPSSSRNPSFLSLGYSYVKSGTYVALNWEGRINKFATAGLVFGYEQAENSDVSMSGFPFGISLTLFPLGSAPSSGAYANLQVGYSYVSADEKSSAILSDAPSGYLYYKASLGGVFAYENMGIFAGVGVLGRPMKKTYTGDVFNDTTLDYDTVTSRNPLSGTFFVAEFGLLGIF